MRDPECRFPGTAARHGRLVAVLAGAVVLAVAAAAPAQETFTARHVASIRTVLSVAASPDGQEFAYVLAVPRLPFEHDDGPAWTELHVVRADGRSRPYVAGPVNVANVRWTPDGRGLAFLARRTGDETRALYVIPRDGGEAQRVPVHGADIAAFE